MTAANWKERNRPYRRYLQRLGDLYNSRQDVRTFVEILLTLGTISLFGLFAIKPTVITISRLWREIKDKEKIVATMDEKIDNLSSAQALYQQEKANIDLLKFAISDEPKPEVILRQIEGLAKINNIAVYAQEIEDVVLRGEKSKSDDGAKQEEIAALPNNSTGYDVMVSVRGEYESMMNFLRDLENMRKPLYVDGVNFIVQSERDEKFLQLDVLGRAVFYNDKN